MDIGGVVISFFKNAGPGGVFVLLVIGGACTLYYSLARWIVGERAAKPITQPEEAPESTHA